MTALIGAKIISYQKIQKGIDVKHCFKLDSGIVLVFMHEEYEGKLGLYIPKEKEAHAKSFFKEI